MYNFTFTVMNTVQPLVDIRNATSSPEHMKTCVGKTKMAFYSMNMPSTRSTDETVTTTVYFTLLLGVKFLKWK